MPSDNLSSPDLVKIDAASQRMTVTLKDLKNRDLYNVDLEPVV